MSNKSRYSLRSCAIDMGTISSRTRSSGVKISEAQLALPARKRAIRVKSEPSGVVIKVERPDVEESAETTTIPEPVLPPKREPEASTSSNVPVPEVEFPPSPASSSRSSSPIFLKAEPRASPPLTTISSSSSRSSTISLSSASSSCSSFHLSSSSPPRSQRDDSMDSWSNPTSINDAPSGSTAKVWDMQNGQLVIRELPLVQTAAEKPRYEQERSVSPFYRGRPYRRPYYRPYYKKPYYKKPYKPYWKRNNRGGPGASRWDCRCSGDTCSNCGAVTTYQSNNQPMNIHCDISINAPSTHQSSSVYIEELSGISINAPSTHQSSSVQIEELSDEGNSSSSYKKKSKTSNAVALPETVGSYYSVGTPVIVPVPVPVVVPQPAFYYQANAQISYSYMWYNVSCSTRFF